MGSAAARQHVKSSLLRTPSWEESFPERIRGWLEQTGPSVLEISSMSHSSRSHVDLEFQSVNPVPITGKV
jgi:hypothetical protein